MKLINLLDSTSFKLSALYLALFSVSFLVLGVTVYWLTTHTLEQQLKVAIEIEADRLKSEYDSDGLEELKEEIAENDCMALRTSGILDRNGKLVGGNFGRFELSPGWQIVSYEGTAQRDKAQIKQLIYLKVVPLSNRIWLGVGRDGSYIRNTGEAIIEAFLWSLLLVLSLGLTGGVYISRSFLRKIYCITSSTEAIIEGDLHRRLPVSKNQDELDKLALLLNHMLDKIGALIENVQQVSNDIAHDLRTPISHLQFRLEHALNQDLSTAQYRHQIKLAIEEIYNILGTFSALLRISQIETGSRRTAFKTVNLSDLVSSVVEALSPVAQERRKTLTSDIEKNLDLTGDRELLTQLTFNLLENAIVHTPADTAINVALSKPGNRINLIVSDHGQGIPEKSRDKVLLRFVRLEQSRTAPGYGLGLSIVAAIVELHGGELSLADNHPGLKVVVGLPAG